MYINCLMLPTIYQAAALIRAGKLSARELLETCLANIDRYESRVRAWVLVDRDRARAEAQTADTERARGIDRGPLHGIPVAIKDIIDVFDWPTACGSHRWANAYARHDAPVVAKLRQAGAVLIGKTVTTQYASFDPPPTRNPWNLSRTPGGSSSGSAAAVASGMCMAALGSQTGGSITRPASYCGVTACKPTYGRTSLEGVLPLAASMDHIGPLAKCVSDVALIMRTISTSERVETQPMPSPITPPRLMRPRGFFDRYASADVQQMMDLVCNDLIAHGATVYDCVLPSAFESVTAHHRAVMATESALYHRERFRRHPEDYGPNISKLLEEGLACSAPDYAAAKTAQRELSGEMNAMLRGGAVMICPATTTVAPDAATTGDPLFNSPWSFTGLPLVSVPSRLSPDRLPLAIQLIAEAWHEEHLFAIAGWCERALLPNLGTALEALATGVDFV